jgi:hypothetical protein
MLENTLNKNLMQQALAS